MKNGELNALLMQTRSAKNECDTERKTAMIEKSFISLGCAPYNEDCVQTTDGDYSSKGRDECNRYIELLRKKFGNEPQGARLKIARERHDFGYYYDVAIDVDTDIEEAIEWAFNIERNAPANWDD
jgi:hypothetical protein